MEPAFEEKMKSALKYDPETGEITGPISITKRDGYLSVTYDGYRYAAANVAWLLHHGDWPPDGYLVDHKNRIRSDNRLVNLRLATRRQNQQNKAGYGTYAKGVTWRDRLFKPYQAKIRIEGKRIHLGSFATEEEAAEAYREAALKYHGEFACHE